NPSSVPAPSMAWSPTASWCRSPAAATPCPPERSGEQSGTDRVVRVLEPRRHEEVAATGGADVVDQRLVDQPLLGGLELALDVLLEAGEDQAHVEVAVEVDAAVVAVAAAQDAAHVGLRRPRVGHADVRVEADGSPAGVLRVVDGVVLVHRSLRRP